MDPHASLLKLLRSTSELEKKLQKKFKINLDIFTKLKCLFFDKTIF